ncbi:MAG: 2-hydroxycarboxylate transporter family protein, partial [Proteobacteria bacterium]|nr:2-hydroxycarboxylate transporter family protein [Pseudomonadota bacterium]
MDTRVGIVPLPVAVLGLGVVAAFVALGAPPSDILMSILVLTLGGFACAEIGKRTPGLRALGLAAILATFLPSWLVYAHLLPKSLVKSIGAFTDQSNFLYLFIAAIIVGSILGMDRRVLIAGFLKIFAPLAVGSVAATAVGCAVGAALGLGLKHAFFMVVAPIMAGGVGEGAIPLTVGYALYSHQPQGALFAEVLPAVMLGSLTAILFAGGLNALGKRYPALTGEGRLQPGEA